MPVFTTRRTVEFADSDMGGVVHFSRYLVFMETAEHQFLRSRDVDVHSRIDGKLISWPRVAASCEYLQPARYRDELEIEVRVLRRGQKSVTYGFRFTRDGQPVAQGEMTAVCCAVEPESGRLESVPIPEEIASRIGEGEENAGKHGDGRVR